MNRDRAWMRLNVAALIALILGGAGCIVGALIDEAAFFPAWLCAFLLWLGVPLGAVTLILVHDLTGGRWMATARPSLEAAAATMPVATIAFLPILAGMGHVYAWSAPGRPGLGNAFYLNDSFFFFRYALYFVLWNGFAAFALRAQRNAAIGVASGLSWVSALGLVLLAYSASFAAIDWIMSLEPHFWSAVFGMITCAGWFNTGLALVLLTLALRGPVNAASDKIYRDHLADLAAILLATTIFWAYVEFCQFLIIWEEDLKHEIPWYLQRMAGAWDAVMYTIAATGFFVPFFALLWRPSKRSRGVVAAIALLILASRVIYAWWLVLPEFPQIGFGWLDAAAVLALGGLMLLLFLRRLRYGRLLPARERPALEASHERA
jgi:hypothetical protein